MSQEGKQWTWYVERDPESNGDYYVSDYPGYCDEDIPGLPEEAELVLKSDYEKAVEALDGVESILVCAAISPPSHLPDIIQTALERIKNVLKELGEVE